MGAEPGGLTPNFCDCPVESLSGRNNLGSHVEPYPTDGMDIGCPIVLPGSKSRTGDVNNVAGGNAGASNLAAGQALSHSLRSRGGTGGNVQASRNRLSFIAGSDRPGGGSTVWGEIRYTDFDDTLNGNGTDLTIGIDTTLGNGLIVGALLSYGDYDLTSGGTSFQTEAWSVGPYVSANLTNRYNFNAYVLFASPDYTSGALTFEADRVLAGMSVDTTYTLGKFEARSFLAVSGFREELPTGAPGGARTVSTTVGSIGTRVDLAPGATTRPYVQLAAETIRFEDGITSTNSVSPRIGLGIDHDFANGTFKASIEGGEIFDGARDVSVALGLDLNF